MTAVIRDEEGTLFKSADFGFIMRKIQEAEEDSQVEINKAAFKDSTDDYYLDGDNVKNILKLIGHRGRVSRKSSGRTMMRTPEENRIHFQSGLPNI
jgi:hypothetical protein